MSTPSARFTRAAALRLPCLLLALASLSCASVAQLARRSEEARQEGDYERAYELALEARRKDPEAPQARSAVDEAVWALLDQQKREIRGLVRMGDSLGAATRTLDLDRLRERFDHDEVAYPADSAFESEERRIRLAGAAWYYDLGQQSLVERRPKDAWRRLVTARELVPGFRDLDRLVPRVWERALTRVAVLPFNDEVGIPEIPRPLADDLWLRLAPRVKPAEFTFTRLVAPAEVWREVRAGEVGRIDRVRAAAIGRAVGAQRVVFGRIWNLRTHTDTRDWTESIWHPVTEKDTSGNQRELWVEVPFRAVSRLLTVHVRVTFDVVDTDSATIVERREVPFDVAAHTAWTRQQVDGDPDDYRLVAPHLEKSDETRARRIARGWEAEFGPWTLPELLQRAREHRAGRAGYRSDMRAEFASAHPHGRVFLDDLPPPELLAAFAVGDVYGPLLETLRRLDER